MSEARASGERSSASTEGSSSVAHERTPASAEGASSVSHEGASASAEGASSVSHERTSASAERASSAPTERSSASAEPVSAPAEAGSASTAAAPRVSREGETCNHKQRQSSSAQRDHFVGHGNTSIAGVLPGLALLSLNVTPVPGPTFTLQILEMTPAALGCGRGATMLTFLLELGLLVHGGALSEMAPGAGHPEERAAQLSRNRTGSPWAGPAISPSHMTRRPRTNVPTGQPCTLTPS